MVVGLAPGGSCRGIAYAVAAEAAQGVLAYLDAREGPGYRRLELPLDVEHDGGHHAVTGWVYLPEPTHPTYAPGLPRARIVELLSTGVGESGAARDYLRELIGELARLGVDDPALRAILAAVERRNGGEAAAPAAGG